MLYPKKYIIEEEKNIVEILEYIKESAIILIKAFRNYNSFMLFCYQKFHF